MTAKIGTPTSFCKNNLIDWTQAVTVDAWANCLWVGVAVNRWDAGTRQIATMTYDGVSMTKDGQADLGDEDMHWQWWYIFNPSTGSNNLVATHSGTGDIAHSVHCLPLGKIDTAVNPRTPVTNASAGVASRAATVTTEVGDLVIAIAGPNASRDISASAGSTETSEVYCSHDVQLVDGWAGYRHATGISTAVGCEWTGTAKAGICANAFATVRAGSQGIMIWSKMQNFYDELKRGLIPASQLQKRYNEAMAI